MHRDRSRSVMVFRWLLAIALTSPAWLVAASAMARPADSASDLAARVQSHGPDDGLAVVPAGEGARLRCVYQRIAGQATGEGLWLHDEERGAASARFRVVARRLGRHGGAHAVTLARRGAVEVAGDLVRFVRPALVEEYSASVDGVRQDFVVAAPPPGCGELRVALEVTGARVEPADYGVQLVLDDSGREIGYSRLHVTDAQGRALDARFEVGADPGAIAVVVDDEGAVYPVRIDPTFSDANWLSMGIAPTLDNGVSDMDVDGSGNLYIAGSFTSVGNLVANRVARWNGTAWSALGSGLDETVSDIVVSGSDVYVGGNFTTAGGVSAARIARWNGSAWSALGTGMNGHVGALVVAGGELWAGGSFTTAGGISALRIAKWNGSAWSPVGTGMVGGDVYNLAVSGTDVYAGGSFTTAGGIAANRIAKWNGSAWSALGTGVNNYVLALAVSETDLYAGGAFTTAGGNPALRMARWNGSAWFAMGTGTDGEVDALAVSGSNVYASGDFFTAGGVAALRVARWSGSAWSSLGTGLDGSAGSLAVIGSDLYVGGGFRVAGGTSAIYLAKWNGSAWSAVGPQTGSGLNGPVNALATMGTDLYVAGRFTMAGSIAATRIAKWDGTSWSALGLGLTGSSIAEVNALAVSGTDLYAGGTFNQAGGVAVNNIAKWNGSAWSALGTGVSSIVSALAVSGSDLYVGGNFSTAGGSPAARIARWNGTTWSALGAGTSHQVTAIAISGTDVYAAGFFTTAGGSPASRVAKWSGSAWSTLGTGVGGSGVPRALAFVGSDLYMAGDFNSVGGVATNDIAKWNGSAWSGVGGGAELAGGINALAVSGTDLYAAGSFPTMGGLDANGIARWNGSSWSTFGSGINTGALAALVSGSDLYVGGWFSAAGGKLSSNLARAIVHSTPEVQSIADIGEDQGGWARLRFARSEFDHAAETAFPVAGYQIHRRIDATSLANGLRGGGPADPVAASLPGTWEAVGWVAATQSDVYTIPVPTRADSTEDGVAWSVYLVTAHTTTPSLWFGSDPDSGYSVDNLAPNVPSGFAATRQSGGINQLVWDDPEDEDFRYFRVYRSTDPGFTPHPSLLVHETTATSWNDAGAGGTTVYYKLVAVDFAGNASAPAASSVTVGVESGETPLRFALHPVAPNPARGSARFAFDVPVAGGAVELSLYDLGGRRVRVLAAGAHAPGERSIAWNGRDDGGHPLPAGLYLVRLRAPGFTQVRKLILAR